MKVLLCAEAPLESEANASIRGAIHDGWAQFLSPEDVVSVGLSGVGRAIARFRPNLVLGCGSYLPDTAYFREATEAARAIGAPSAFWATEDPYERDASYRIEHMFDAIFTCDRWGANFYNHRHAFHLPLAACPVRHFNEIFEGADRPIDVLFCGVAFTSRKEVMQELLPALSDLNLAIIGPGWGGLGPGFTDRRVSKSELIELYGRSKLVLNLGRSLHFENNRYCILPSTPGPRTFEAAMAGALQIFHEDTAELQTYFSAGEVPVFSSPYDFNLLLRALLPDGSRRDQIAQSAQRRCQRDHTYAHRAANIVGTLKSVGLL